MMKKTSNALAIAVILAIGFCHVGTGAEPSATQTFTKDLILPGEVFSLGGKTAFLFTPAGDPAPAGKRPWILYSPTLPAYPDKAERWMHEKFLAAGIAVAGLVDFLIDRARAAAAQPNAP